MELLSQILCSKQYIGTMKLSTCILKHENLQIIHDLAQFENYLIKTSKNVTDCLQEFWYTVMWNNEWMKISP